MSKLFSSIKYFTTGFRDSTIETKFKENGATRLFYLTEKTTHVICDDFASNKDELEQAIEIYQTPIVTSDWITACLKSNTLLSIDSYRSIDNKNINDNEDNSKHLFQSCTFANANLMNEDHNKIYALATYYGGRWIANLDSFVCTHVICASALGKIGDANNNHEQIDERLQDAYEIQSDKVYLITPDWIIDCIKANHLFDEANYHPDLLRNLDDSMEVDDNTNTRSSKKVRVN
jgi:PAX-interacting protein 1